MVGKVRSIFEYSSPEVIMKRRYLGTAGALGAVAIATSSALAGCTASSATDEDLGSVQQAGTLLLKCPSTSANPIGGTGSSSTSGMADLGTKLFDSCEAAKNDVHCDNSDADDILDAAEARALKKCARDIENTFSCQEPCRKEIAAEPCKVETSDRGSTEACQEVESDDGTIQYVGYCSLWAWASAAGESTGRCI
jgi:hypothetical protein